ncbi:hypothetical protein NLU13_7914 [Sarocladium strictum]|uniref:Uncharacterized protein n=1 Tax=Sarocladium strictum TaxID=5046 RepID=A0AA39GEW2_SARSR|nr:hypothetical protein NLU13_7914 [Sarocladium strictum]
MSNHDEKPLVGVNANLAVPEKAALPSVVTTTTPVKSKSARSSADLTPRTDKTENPFDTDLEAMLPANESTLPGCVRRETTNKNDCQVWPGVAEWKQKAKEAKAARTRKSCNCLAGLSHRNRIIAKILIVLLIVGIAVGVGFGVSKPLGAPIWGNN